VLKILFQLHYLTISHKVKFQELAIMSVIPGGRVIIINDKNNLDSHATADFILIKALSYLTPVTVCPGLAETEEEHRYYY
jgi:hypothetical protein